MMLLPYEEQILWPRRHTWRDRLREAEERNWETLRGIGNQPRHHLSENATYILADAIEFLSSLPASSLHAIVTDPPYGLSTKRKIMLSFGPEGVVFGEFRHLSMGRIESRCRGSRYSQNRIWGGSIASSRSSGI
jgi:hypothetical protein